MKILRNSILASSLLSVLVATNSAEALEVAAWNGTAVNSFDLGYQAPTTASSDVNTTGLATGGQAGTGVTITDAVVGTPGSIGFDSSEYLQFKIAAQTGKSLLIDSFELTTAASSGLGTTISWSTAENGTYTNLATLGNLSQGTNSFSFSSSVPIGSGSTVYFRLTSLATGSISYNLSDKVLVFVPEPSTYALSAAGIAVLGYAGRNRRKKASKRSDG